MKGQEFQQLPHSEECRARIKRSERELVKKMREDEKAKIKAAIEESIKEA